MEIGIIDGDLIYNNLRLNFPNLACMKLSQYHKNKGDNVDLITDINKKIDYDKVYISKVFTKTPDPRIKTVSSKTVVIRGGSGFFYDKAPALPCNIEHSAPDYSLYKNCCSYTSNKDFFGCDIGYTSRGCFRRCPFCINRNSRGSVIHSDPAEFVADCNKKITLLDDNVFSCKEWRSIFEKLQATGKPFTYKQGLDERLLDEQKAKILFSSKWHGFYTFAFDNIKDMNLIKEKTKLIHKYRHKNEVRFYVLSGYPSASIEDIKTVLIRIGFLRSQGFFPYIMRFETVYNSQFNGIYTLLASWCNQPGFFRNCSLDDFNDNFDISA